jgi:hypothetical protein
MAKKLMRVTVRGHKHTWSFRTYQDPSNLAEWRADGLEIVEVENSVPMRLPAGLTRAWCFAQDVFNFRNPWGKA